MSQSVKLIVAAAGGRLAALPPDVIPAHMSYRMDAAPRLMRSAAPCPQRGGLLYLPGCREELQGAWAPFLQQLVRECTLQHFSGVIADFEGCTQRSVRSLAREMDRVLCGRGLQLYLPEAFAADAPHARILVSSAISGGSLEVRLEEAQKTYGPGRVVLALEKIAEDFTPPARSGRGLPLTPESLSALMHRLRPNIFWSGALCARYFTYFESSGRTHFVLFDDSDTLKAKLRLANDLGISQALAADADLGSAWFT